MIVAQNSYRLMTRDPTANSEAPFQFSLAAMLHGVTGVSVLLALSTWHPYIGGPIGILLVSAWWSKLAHRAGRRKTAYYFTTGAMGVFAYVVLSVPWSPATWFILRGFADFSGPDHARRWLQLVPVLLMCLATLAGAAMLRRRIRESKPNNPVGLGFSAAYLTAYVFGVAWCVFAVIWEVFNFRAGPIDVGGIIGFFVLALAVGIPLVVTLSLHVAVPTAIWFVVILRRINPAEEGTDAEGIDDVRDTPAETPSPGEPGGASGYYDLGRTP